MVDARTPSPDDLLRAAGLRRTPVRVAVLNILAKAARPLDVPTILGKLPDQTEVVTVYRTLNTFKRKKIVHRVLGEDRSGRYALGNVEERRAHHHPHFVCDDCGKVNCLNALTIPNSFIRSLGEIDGYTVSYPEVVLHGLCPKCK
ncbi:MAG TPA: Fur family transcriptional regulator [Tepidisphaeraceae bacterium]|nr:Fur family transcriptional regulator [Tepidisphaeraceae bacterium]